jgi:hypothetical protein
MKKSSLYRATTLCAFALCLSLICAYQAPAQTALDPATLFINGGAGDPNLISGSSFKVLQNQGGAATLANVVLLFSVPGVTTSPSGISGLTSSAGAVGGLSLVGILATSLSCNNTASGLDVYSCAGISGTDQSNSLVNFNGAEQTANGFTAAQYGIFEVTITGANLAAKGSITINGSIPVGTFVDAFGVDAKGTIYATPFTEAGLTTGGGGSPPPVPEPASMLLMGSGLLGLGGMLRRRKKTI